MTLFSRLDMEWTLLSRRFSRWWNGDSDHLAKLQAEIDLALSMRRRSRPVRQEAAKRGWQTRRMA